MNNYIRLALSGAYGAVLTIAGFNLHMWQFWLLVIVFAISCTIVETFTRFK